MWFFTFQSKKMYFCRRLKIKNMDRLFKAYGRLLAETDLKFTRYLYDNVNWDNRLIVIKGAKGVARRPCCCSISRRIFPMWKKHCAPRSTICGLPHTPSLNWRNIIIHMGGRIFFWMKYTNTRDGSKRSRTFMIPILVCISW